MLILSGTTEQIQVVLSGSVTTNQLSCVSCWRDVTTTAYTPGRTAINTNNTTDIDVVPAPSVSTQRVIDTISVFNKDTANATVTVKLDIGGTEYIIFKATLVPDGRLTYTEGAGWDVYAPSNIVTLNGYNSGYSDYAAIADPTTPGAGVLRVYAKLISGRAMPKWVPQSGVDCICQPSLFNNSIILYTPTSGTTVTGGFGTLWAKGSSAGTVNTPTPVSTSPAIINQIKRTRHVNAVTTTNQVMGITATASGQPQHWRGNSAGLGGFFFFCRFVIELWPANSCRIFVGMTPGTAEAAASDTFPVNSVGLWHDTTHGNNVLYFATKDASTLTLGTAIPSAVIAAGQGFDLYIYCPPNDSNIYYRVDDINAGTTLIDTSTSTTLPANTVFLGPQATVSNGTANITATTVGIGVARIYVESDF